MGSWRDVEQVVATLPEVVEATSYGHRAWKVRGKTFCWDRPLSGADRRRLLDAGVEPYDGDLLAVRVADEGAKRAVLADASLPCFTIAHFEGFPAVLVRLADASRVQLEELITEAWLDRAPAGVRAQWRGPTTN